VLAMLAPPRLVNAQVPRKGVQPRREFGLALVGLGALDDAHEGFLEEVLRGLLVADEPQDEVEDRLAMPRPQNLQGADLALLVHHHQVFVGSVVEHRALTARGTLTRSPTPRGTTAYGARLARFAD